MAHGRSEVRCGVSALGGLVRMLYDKLLFVATAEVDVVVGSFSMHTLHSFVWNGLVALTFSVTGRERLIQSHSSARFSFELSGNSN